jgi:hypothetical protein
VSAAFEQVGIGLAEQSVGPFATRQAVIALAAAQLVGMLAAVQAVMAVLPEQKIIVVAACQRVRAVVAGQRVGASVAEQLVVAARPEDAVGAGIAGQTVARVVAEDAVVARPADRVLDDDARHAIDVGQRICVVVGDHEAAAYVPGLAHQAVGVVDVQAKIDVERSQRDAHIVAARVLYRVSAAGVPDRRPCRRRCPRRLWIVCAWKRVSVVPGSERGIRTVEILDRGDIEGRGRIKVAVILDVLPARVLDEL